MAILMGFPPSNTISPSVRITERDLSFIAPQQSTNNAGLIGFASKGPVNLPTLISTSRQLTTIFGNPHPDVGDPFLIYAAQQYLLVANTLYVVRIADTDPVSDEQALTATVDVPAAGTIIDIVSTTAGPYSFDTDSFFRWKLNGVLSSKTLVVLSDANRPAPYTGMAYSTDELVEELNSQLDIQSEGIEFHKYTSGPNDYIAVKTVWAYGLDSSLEFVSVQNAIYGYDGVTGLGSGMTQALVVGSLSKYPSSESVAGNYNLTGLTGLNLQIVLDGTDNVLIDGIVQTIDLSALEGSTHTIGDIVTAINAEKVENGGTLPGGWDAVAVGNNLQFVTMASGRDSRLRIKSQSTAATIFGLDTVTHAGTSPSGATNDVAVTTFGIITGAANITNDVSFTVNADSPGIDGNMTQVVISNDTRDNHFVITVYNNGNPVETWGSLTKDTASSYYVETYISLVSDYIRVTDNTSVGAGPKNGTYTLVGGTDGIPSDPDKQDALLIGDPVSYTGIYTLSEPEQINIDLVAVPGHSSTAVIQALLNLCQSYRQDCLAIIDPPFGFTVEEIIAWQNGTHPLNNDKFDSDFGALYWPWVKLYDTHNRVDVWVPPSGSIMAVIARSDFIGAPWFAPAGITRGAVPTITDVYSRPTLAQRDLMYGNSNCINPIVQFPDVGGFLVWGQKTLQRRPSALDRVNVRRMMFYVEKQIRIASRSLLFEPNDDTFRTNFVKIASAILTKVKVGRGLNDFTILADTTINTPDVIDRNEFRAQIGIQPTYAAEFIFIEFSINKTGDFSSPA